MVSTKSPRTSGLDTFPDIEARKLADAIHYATCFYSHTDQCSFGYESQYWGSAENMRYTLVEHQRCYDMALRNIVLFGKEAIMVYLNIKDKLVTG